MSNRPKATPARRRGAGRPTISTTPEAPPIWQRPVVWVGAVIAIAAIVTIALAGGSDGARTLEDETAFSEAYGASIPDFAQPDRAVGMEAPVISAETLDGERVQVTADGTGRLIGFFAHWCPHCQREVPVVVDWLGTNPLPDGVEVLAVSTSVEPSAENFPPSAWFDREGWPTTVLLDSETGTIANGFGLTGFPFWVAIDGDGTIVARASGSLDATALDALAAAVAP